MSLINIFSCVPYYKNIDSVFSFLNLQFHDFKNRRDGYYAKKIKNLSEYDPGVLSNATFAIAHLFHKICQAYGNLKSKQDDFEMKKAYLLNVQNNLRAIKNVLSKEMALKLDDPLFFNRESNKIHKRHLTAGISHIINKAIIAEMRAYCKVKKTSLLCTEYEDKVVKTRTYNRKGYTETVISEEHDLLEKVWETTKDRKLSNRLRLLKIQSMTTETINVNLFMKTEDKTFHSFMKNLIRTLFGIKCLFGTQFWEKKAFDKFATKINSVIKPRLFQAKPPSAIKK